jgi:hypothetical protein
MRGRSGAERGGACSGVRSILNDLSLQLVGGRAASRVRAFTPFRDPL